MITLKTENTAGVLDVLGNDATYAARTWHAWRSRYWMTKYKTMERLARKGIQI